MEILKIREAKAEDLQSLLSLYQFLHPDVPAADSLKTAAVWNRILQDDTQKLLIGEEDGNLVSSLVLIIVDNLTRNGRPYAVIENLVTHPDRRRKGYALQMMEAARHRAEACGCYKIMLMTGSKDPGVWRFYEKAGYNAKDKRPFIRWLENSSAD